MHCPSYAMIITRGSSQSSYPNGSMMCTSACLVLGIATATRRVDLSDEGISCKQVLEMAMELGSRAQGRIESIARDNSGRAIGGIPFGVMDVLNGLEIDVESLGLKIHEYVIQRDVKRGGGIELKSQCLINCEELIDCMTRIGSSSSCILTYDGHSTCMSQRDAVFSFFDPSPSVLVNNMSRDDANRMVESMRRDVGRYNGSQCDATVLYNP